MVDLSIVTLVYQRVNRVMGLLDLAKFMDDHEIS
jgi:hypothetical protein